MDSIRQQTVLGHQMVSSCGVAVHLHVYVHSLPLFTVSLQGPPLYRHVLLPGYFGGWYSDDGK